jgi:hypothetical protein
MQERNAGLVGNLEPDFVSHTNIQYQLGDVISRYLALPGLVGFWPMSSVDMSNGNAHDLSGQGRTLSYNGNPTYNIHNSFVPYIDLDGTGDYLSRADEAGLRITGGESHNASAVQGLTMYCWCNVDVLPAGTGQIIGKWVGAASKSYRTTVTSDGSIQAQTSTDGSSNSTGVAISMSVDEWLFTATRFVPSTSHDLWVGTSSGITKASDTSSIPATIFNSASSLTIGANSSGGDLLNGFVSLAALCANSHPDSLVESVFFQTRAPFGV